MDIRHASFIYSRDKSRQVSDNASAESDDEYRSFFIVSGYPGRQSQRDVRGFGLFGIGDEFEPDGEPVIMKSRFQVSLVEVEKPFIRNYDGVFAETEFSQ